MRDPTVRRLLPAAAYGWASVRPAFIPSNFLLYLGALVVLFASYGLLDTLSDGQAFAWASLELAVLLGLAALMYIVRRPISGGLLSFVAAALSVVWITSLLRLVDWWPEGDEPLRVDFEGPYLVSVLVVLAFSSLLLAATRFPFVGLVVAVSLWYLLSYLGTVVFLDELDRDQLAGVAFVVGLLLAGAAALVDDTRFRLPSFWLHLVGLLSFYAGLLALWTDSDWGWFGVWLVSLVAVLSAMLLSRAVYAVFGGLGLLLASGHFIDEWTSDVLGFGLATGLERGDSWRPWLAYAALGLLLMFLGMLVALGEGEAWRRFLVRVRAFAPGSRREPLDTLAPDSETVDARPAEAEPVEGAVEVETPAEEVVESVESVERPPEERS